MRLNLINFRNDVVAAGVLGFVGDVACQLVVEKSDRVDARRLVALTSFNACYIGGFLHFAYQLFPRIAARVFPFHGSLGSALVDNVHNGIIYIPTYYIAVGVLEGKSTQAATQNLEREWWKTYTTCSMFWIPYSWFNFSIIPTPDRVRFMAVGNLVWSVFIDWISHRNSSSLP